MLSVHPVNGITLSLLVQFHAVCSLRSHSHRLLTSLLCQKAIQQFQALPIRHNLLKSPARGVLARLVEGLPTDCVKIYAANPAA
jgi:hypothetical protein